MQPLVFFNTAATTLSGAALRAILSILFWPFLVPYTKIYEGHLFCLYRVYRVQSSFNKRVGLPSFHNVYVLPNGIQGCTYYFSGILLILWAMKIMGHENNSLLFSTSVSSCTNSIIPVLQLMVISSCNFIRLSI